MIPSEFTIEKLRKLQAFILEEPRRFNLDFWGVHIDSAEKQKLDASTAYYQDRVDKIAQRLDFELGLRHIAAALQAFPPCGTVACLAGNMCVMEGIVQPHKVGKQEFYTFNEDTPELAASALGITGSDGDKLFYLSSWHGDEYGWPAEFEKRLNEASPGTKEYAQVAVDRIEYYIKTGE